MGSGKTTAAEYLAGKYNVPVYHFAEPIKQIIAGVPEERQKLSNYLWSWAARLFDGMSKRAEFVRQVSEILDAEKDPGRLAQAIGSAGREIDENVWVRHLMAKIPKQASALVDDVRYPNEVQALEKAGFIVIRVETSELSRRRRLILRGRGAARDYKHISETALDSMELPTVENRTTIEAFQQVLDRIVQKGPQFLTRRAAEICPTAV